MVALVGAGLWATGTDSSSPSWGAGSRSPGNLLLAVTATGNSAGTPVTNSLSGWSAVPTASSASGHSYLNLWWRTALGSDSPPSFGTSDSATFLAAALLEISTGAPATWSLDSATATATATSGSSLTVATAAPATNSNVALGLWMQSQAAGTVTLTPSSGWTNASQYTATSVYHCGVDLQPGAVGAVSETESATGSTPTLWLGQICIFDSATNVVSPDSGAADDENKYSTMSWPGDPLAPQNVPFDVSVFG